MNVEELRAVLAEQILKIKSGKADAPTVNAMSNAAGKLLASVRLEMEYCRMIGVKPAISFIKIPAAPSATRAPAAAPLPQPRRAKRSTAGGRQ